MATTRRLIGTTAVKVLAAAAFIAGYSVVTEATQWYCTAQHENCSESEYCEGTGIAWSGCQIWCYINQGQELSGYADCVMIEG